jgi:energy-coupling factor transport system permease protein
VTASRVERERSRLLARWNPLTPLALATFLVVASFAGPEPWAPLGASMLALALAAASGIARRVLWVTLGVGVPTFALLFVMNGVVAPADATPLAERFSPRYPATRDALLVALRLAASVSALAWVITGIAPRRLTSALAERGLPSWAAYVIVASLDAVPLARRRAGEVLDAQRCRGVRAGHGLTGRLRTLLPMAGPLIVSLVTETEERALALDARGFVPGRRRTALAPIPDRRWERALRAILWVATGALIVWSLARWARSW